MPPLEELGLSPAPEPPYKKGWREEDVGAEASPSVKPANRAYEKPPRNQKKVAEGGKSRRGGAESGTRTGASAAAAATSQGVKGVGKERSLEDARAKLKLLERLGAELEEIFALASQAGTEVSAVLEVEDSDIIRGQTASHSDGSSRLGIDAAVGPSGLLCRVPAVDWDDIADIGSAAADGLPCSHSSTLETIYTWEKKLYKEVKV
jgi:hypothetical protein